MKHLYTIQNSFMINNLKASSSTFKSQKNSMFTKSVKAGVFDSFLDSINSDNIIILFADFISDKTRCFVSCLV